MANNGMTVGELHGELGALHVCTFKALVRAGGGVVVSVAERDGYVLLGTAREGDIDHGDDPEPFEWAWADSEGPLLPTETGGPEQVRPHFAVAVIQHALGEPNAHLLARFADGTEMAPDEAAVELYQAALQGIGIARELAADIDDDKRRERFMSALRRASRSTDRAEAVLAGLLGIE